MRLIGITGRARSGKDTVGDLLRLRGFERYAFAGPLKAGVREMFGLSTEHTDGEWKDTVLPWLGRSPRYLLQTLGTEWGRQMVAEDVWLRLAQKRLDDLREDMACTFAPWRGLVVTDVRFENEAAWVRRNGGQVWHVVRPRTSRVEEHASEAGIAFQAGDAALFNTGTLEELERRALSLLDREASHG